MITYNQTGYGTASYNGLSTDVKPTAGLENGTEFYEINTGDYYYWDEENSQWVKSATGKLPL